MEVSASSLPSSPVIVAVLLGALSVLAALWRRRSKSVPAGDGIAEIPEGRPAGLPEDGIFNLDLLQHFDGRPGQSLPLCLCCCGKVVDCSASESIKFGEGYGKLWAGKDATYALAKLSLKPEEANKMDFTLEDFSKEEKTALAGWYKHFTTKYRVVGQLTEYEGWDFSEIETLSESQKPFSSSDADADASAAVASPDAQSQPAESTTFRAGDRVILQNIKSQPNLNGRTGTLKLYNKEKKRFGVALDDGGETILLQPSCLKKAPS